jgi:hypothetical protein
MKTTLSLLLVLALAATAVAQEEDNVRDNMWKLWQSTVSAPDATVEGQDAGQQAQDSPSDESNPPVSAGTTTEPIEPEPRRAMPEAPAIQPIEPVRERLIPVQIVPSEKPDQAQADGSDETSDQAGLPGQPSADPNQGAGDEQESPTRPERPDPTHTDSTVHLAGDDRTPERPAGTNENGAQTDREQGELPTGLEQFQTPPALIAALKLAQVSSADKVKDPAGLADRLYTRNLRRPAEYFYRAALVRQKDIDRAWVLLQLGNCLQDHDVAGAGEQYATVLAEFPDSPWATMAKVQQEICRYRLRHRDDTLTGDVLREVHEGTTDQLDELLKDLVKEDQP